MPLGCVLKWIAAIGGAEDGAADVENAAHILGVEQAHAVFVQQPFETAFDAVNFPAAIERASDHRANHRVEAGTIAAASDDADPFRLRAGLTLGRHS